LQLQRVVMFCFLGNVDIKLIHLNIEFSVLHHR